MVGSEEFYAAALERIRRVMVALASAALILILVFLGWRSTVGFAIGAVIAFLNFHWLKRVVADLSDVTIHSGASASIRGVVLRFLARYFLMAVASFVILTVSRESLYGLFAGLFLPVAAILCEAVYETCKVISGCVTDN